MTRLLHIWMAFAQTVNLLSLLPWLWMGRFISAALARPGAPQLVWPWFAVTLFTLYFLVVCGLSIAAWLRYAKRDHQLAAILISLPLFFSLPMTAVALVSWLSTR